MLIYPHIINAAARHCSISVPRVERERNTSTSRLGGKDGMLRQEAIAAYYLEKNRINYNSLWGKSPLPIFQNHKQVSITQVTTGFRAPHPHFKSFTHTPKSQTGPNNLMLPPQKSENEWHLFLFFPHPFWLLLDNDTLWTTDLPSWFSLVDLFIADMRFYIWK